MLEKMKVLGTRVRDRQTSGASINFSELKSTEGRKPDRNEKLDLRGEGGLGESGNFPKLGHRRLYKENNESEEHLRESEANSRHITEEGWRQDPETSRRR